LSATPRPAYTGGLLEGFDMAPTPLILLLATALLAAAPLGAQTPAPATPPDPVVARVNDQEIRLSDLAEAAEGLPAQYRAMPRQVLFPLLTDQLIDRAAVAAMARSQGLDRDPAVQRQIARAAESTLENAMMSREIAPAITEEAIHARYDAEIAGKPGEEEVRARHILVATEADANKVLEDLKAGGDFAAIAKARSSDPGAAAQGGDLGFFKKGDMVPEFADMAFSLKPGETAPRPVKTQFGWHVIKVEERRNAPAPTFEEAHDGLRQKIIQEGVQKLVASARATVKVERFNPDGTAPRATDGATPPPAPPKP
jgi:peptidyl-prolyl cis-trans isomerase C